MGGFKGEKMMNKRQRKKEFRKYVRTFPHGRRSKAGIWLKKKARKYDADLLATDLLEYGK